MAALGRSLFGLRNTLKVGVTRGFLHPQNKPGRQLDSARNMLVTKSGAILPKPEKTSFGLVKVFIVVIPFLYMGTLISKSFASLLEEHDIFVPADDDDDD
ncbi:single-pass membrane protein with aspartate-rich tail 1b [Pristis pectinata]|uniref:single-pass membrane protein with aspartate-rich tail 1b n=1 Tax=Pristis pectinata TaxID=685728 RepID=UPI00223CB29C|nr:single-pass membrane protein with aspartate-rich tail 1b [Pristis pectinata]